MTDIRDMTADERIEYGIEHQTYAYHYPPAGTGAHFGLVQLLRWAEDGEYGTQKGVPHVYVRCIGTDHPHAYLTSAHLTALVAEEVGEEQGMETKINPGSVQVIVEQMREHGKRVGDPGPEPCQYHPEELEYHLGGLCLSKTKTLAFAAPVAGAAECETVDDKWTGSMKHGHKNTMRDADGCSICVAAMPESLRPENRPCDRCLDGRRVVHGDDCPPLAKAGDVCPGMPCPACERGITYTETTP